MHGIAQQHQQVEVESQQHFDTAVQHYISLGYRPRQMNDELAILTRATRQKGLGCGFVFWCVAFFPIAIVMFFNRSRQPGEDTLTIRLLKSVAPELPRPAAFEPTSPQRLKMSDDHESWWDGGDWVSADEATPPMARRSADGNLWWDGRQWRAIS